MSQYGSEHNSDDQQQPSGPQPKSAVCRKLDTEIHGVRCAVRRVGEYGQDKQPLECIECEIVARSWKVRDIRCRDHGCQCAVVQNAARFPVSGGVTSTMVLLAPSMRNP